VDDQRLACPAAAQALRVVRLHRYVDDILMARDLMTE
jgi:hypothetical protein